eukprot:2952467-Prymnesium_polylepis.1
MLTMPTHTTLDPRVRRPRAHRCFKLPRGADPFVCAGMRSRRAARHRCSTPSTTGCCRRATATTPRARCAVWTAERVSPQRRTLRPYVMLSMPKACRTRRPRCDMTPP